MRFDGERVQFMTGTSAYQVGGPFEVLLRCLVHFIDGLDLMMAYGRRCCFITRSRTMFSLGLMRNETYVSHGSWQCPLQ